MRLGRAGVPPRCDGNLTTTGGEKMTGNPMSPVLRWLFFVVAVGSLIACGIYVGTAMRDPDTSARLLRALMFLLLGLFCVLMYGENKSARGGPDGTADRG
jgi:hypothetical protein